jgi:hypothetical protein
VVSAHVNDVYAIIQKKNGHSYRQEFYYGNNYLSQSSGKLKLSNEIESISFYDAYGNKRTE